MPRNEIFFTGENEAQWQSVNWNGEKTFLNHTFAPGEVIDLPKDDVRLENCTNFPARIRANGISIDSCAGVRIENIECGFLTISSCRSLVGIDKANVSRDVHFYDCPNLVNFSNQIKAANSTVVERCRKYAGELAGSYIFLQEVARLPEHIEGSGDVTIEKCGFRNPDVTVKARSCVRIQDIHCRSLTVLDARSVYIGVKKSVRDLTIESSDTVEIEARNARNLKLGSKARRIVIRKSPNLENVEMHPTYRFLHVIGSSFKFPMPLQAAEIYIPRPHPDQKNYKFFSGSFENDRLPPNFAYLFKTPNGECYAGSSNHGTSVPFNTAYNLSPHFRYKRGLRRKLVLWAKQPFEIS